MLARVTPVHLIEILHFTPFYSVLSHVTLYIQHSKIALYNFIPSLSWSTSSPLSFYYTLPTLPYPTVFAHSFNIQVQTTLCLPFVRSFLCLPNLGDLSTRQKTFYPSVSHYSILNH